MKYLIFNSRLFLFIVLIVILFTPSCASQEEKLILARQEVELINNKLNKAEMITGLMFRDESRFAYRAYFVDGKLLYVFADVIIGGFSGSTNFYYFNKGKLFFISQDEVGFDSKNAKRKRTKKTEIYLDDNQVLESTRIIAGNYADIPPEEIEMIRNDADKLYNLALEKYRASKN